ncbi:hypothetical protein BDN70DRAFT_786157, partial [Pholiota conissans]
MPKPMAYYTSTLLPQQGAHPISSNEVYLPRSLLESCSLHLYYTLPPILFVDTHELGQRSASYSFKYWGTKDLERPVHALSEDISELLINVGTDGHVIDDEGSTVRVEVPMHLRYGRPVWKDGKPYESVTIDWPQAFLQCSTIQPHSSFSPPSLPSHILSALPSSKADSILISILPRFNSSESTQSTLTLPLGNSRDLSVVEPLTALVIIACFLWLLRVSLKVAARIH